MQLILVGAAIVSLVIKEWSAAVVLTLISARERHDRARQQGKPRAR